MSFDVTAPPTAPTLASRLRSPALGGIASQGSQAFASFVLQYLTAQVLGLEALGKFAVVFTLVVLATAISSGFVGDTLAVLDRGQPTIRAALQAWGVFIAASAAIAAGVVSYSVGFLSLPEALFFALATATFVIEDLIRRLLMATLHFWRIVIVDLAALAGALAVLVTISSIEFVHVLAALSVGQVLAFFVGVALLPRTERYVVRWTSGGMRAVASYGVWRSLQQGLRAATMASMRVVLLFIVTASALGGLELARIYMAPAALFVSGISSYLFSTYASSKGSLSDMLARADRAVAKLLVAVGGIGVIAVVAVPFAGSLFTPDGPDAATLSVVAVASWAALAATTAAVTPYGQLASVRGRQRAVFGVRTIESVTSLIAMLVVVRVTDSVDWAPAAMAGCAIPAGFVIRRYLIVADIVRLQSAEDR